MSPMGLTATSGDLNGEIDLVWEPVKGANVYVIQISRFNKGPDSWKQVDVISESSYTISRLKSGQKFRFRVSAASSGGQSQWSDSVIKKVP